MKRLTRDTPSSFGRELCLRLSRKLAEALNIHMRSDPAMEQMAFGLASVSRTAEGTLLYLTQLLFPDRADLKKQTAVSVCPTREFQGLVYFCARESKKAIVEFHSHPGAQAPEFSSIDDTNARENAQYISRKLPEPVTLAMVVSNNRFDALDGLAYDRHREEFRQLDRLEILGRPSEVRYIGEPADVRGAEINPTFDRQKRIPGWNQRQLERQRILIGALGGNGAHVFQTSLSIGAGRQGFIALADPQLVEESNLPRLPYAFAEHLGTPKVTVAAQYAGRKSPSTPVYPYPCSLAEKAVQDRLKMATVIFGCGDNDGLRKELNELAIRYGIPYIDLGCDIQTNGDTVTAGGQVRLVLPGDNACLVCCNGLDLSQAAIDQMDDAARAQRAAQGYVHDSNALATPSVANLNALTAQHAVAQFLALVNGAEFARWDYLHFDQFTGRTIPATTTSR
jgi:molybdopterin/thiamine biosynthesis adenylyltransferase